MNEQVSAIIEILSEFSDDEQQKFLLFLKGLEMAKSTSL